MNDSIIEKLKRKDTLSKVWFQSRYGLGLESGKKRKWPYLAVDKTKPVEITELFKESQIRFNQEDNVDEVIELGSKLDRVWYPLIYQGLASKNFDIICQNTLENISLTALAIHKVKEIPQELKLLHLLYIGAFSNIETLLADMFRVLITKNEKTKLKVFTMGSYRLNTYKPDTFLEMVEDVDKHIDKLIEETIWHRLFKVKEMYKIVSNIDLTDALKPLTKLVQNRHNIVHKNGYTQDGNVVDITFEDLEALLSYCTKLTIFLIDEVGQYLEVN